jgi:hypothetical protein
MGKAPRLIRLAALKLPREDRKIAGIRPLALKRLLLWGQKAWARIADRHETRRIAAHVPIECPILRCCKAQTIQQIDTPRLPVNHPNHLGVKFGIKLIGRIARPEINRLLIARCNIGYKPSTLGAVRKLPK